MSTSTFLDKGNTKQCEIDAAGAIAPIVVSRGVAPGTVAIYRDSVNTPLTAADVLGVPTFALSAIGSGSLTGAAWRCQVVAGNKYGRTTSNAIQTQALTAENLGITITPVAGAEWYDLFVSDDATPIYLGRVTAAQVAAGCSITLGATATANATIGAGVVAGRIDVSVDSTLTGVTVAATISNNTAYTLDAANEIDCTGYGNLEVHLAYTRNSAGALPSVVLLVWLRGGTGEHYLSSAINVPIAAVWPLRQVVTVPVDQNPGVLLTIGSLGGAGAAVSMSTRKQS